MAANNPGKNSFDAKSLRELKVGDQPVFKYYSLASLEDDRVQKLPYCIRILLENVLRNNDGVQVVPQDVDTILDWKKQQGSAEVPFKPARVLLQDFTGVPAVVDLAAMRDAMKRLGGDPKLITPQCPADLVIDHSVQVDVARRPDALARNQSREMERNAERFQFLKWGSKAFDGLKIVPPGAGIVHQVNLEYLARSVFNRSQLLYPDTLVGTDSHTTMINGLGIVGWGVGGIEAEAALLGQAISLVLPQVIGYRLVGKLPAGSTATDLVLTVTEALRRKGVVGKFVEFFGPGVNSISLPDRATLANMCPEYGATVGYFPSDSVSVDYLRSTGRDANRVAWVDAYLRANLLLRTDDAPEPEYTDVVELDLSTVVPALAGPKRPHDLVTLADMPADFQQCLDSKVGFKGFAIPKEAQASSVDVTMDEKKYTLQHGSVVIAAITSCTNTSNAQVMLMAGLVAKRAVEAGLQVAPFVKTSLAPGSHVVTRYLKASGLLPYLEKLGFNVVGYGCTTCIGNSGALFEGVTEAVVEGDLVVASVLSGNRNFEGRVHNQVRASYLASPPLVVAYALAGNVKHDMSVVPLGQDKDGKDIFLKDLWPTSAEVSKIISSVIVPSFFKEVYENMEGSEEWQKLEATNSLLYDWKPESTYVREPPFFESMGIEVEPMKDIEGAHALLNLGDSVTTDHISPAGTIARKSPAGLYLSNKGVSPTSFNTYGSRRGNHEVMMRGTFANVRLVNKLAQGKTGPYTTYTPTKELMSVWDCAERHQKEKHDLVVIAGSAYGSGSSRDWAAKGTLLLGVRAVIAKSYERIHRSNLIGMGVLPLLFNAPETSETLELNGYETYSLSGLPSLTPRGQVQVVATAPDGTKKEFKTTAAINTATELLYLQHGGILNYALRQLLKNN